MPMIWFKGPPRWQWLQIREVYILHWDQTTVHGMPVGGVIPAISMTGYKNKYQFGIFLPPITLIQHLAYPIISASRSLSSHIKTRRGHDVNW